MVDESRLQMAKRHVAEQEGRVARQEKLIERLSEQGLSTKQAEDLLEEMVTMLDDMRAELTRFEPAQKRTKPGPDR